MHDMVVEAIDIDQPNEKLKAVPREYGIQVLISKPLLM